MRSYICLTGTDGPAGDGDVTMTLSEMTVGQKVEVLTSKGGRGTVVKIGRKYATVQVGSKTEQYTPRVLRPAS